jgi:hypothetical protein
MGGVAFADHAELLTGGIAVLPTLWVLTGVESFFPLLEDFLAAPHGSFSSWLMLGRLLTLYKAI